MTTLNRSVGSVAAGLISIGLLAGCMITPDEEGSSVGGGSIETIQSLEGKQLVVSSKGFTESKLLGVITLNALRAAGADPVDRTGIKGSATVRQALTSDEVDMYWEYTGTAWINYLGHDRPIPEPQGQYDAVAEEDKENGIVWLEAAPLNNTYSIAATDENAKEWQVGSMSELAEFARSNPDEATVCIDQEFSTREDGWPGLVKKYDLQIPKKNLKIVDTGVIYTQIADGDACNFGSVFATDGRIPNLKLATLEDDKRFFPVYNAALNVRQKTYSAHPEIADVIEPIAAKLDTKTMQQLNSQVDIEGRQPQDVARDWLRKEGFIG